MPEMLYRFLLQISTNANHQSPIIALSTLCAQIQKVLMSAAAKEDTKEMGRSVKVSSFSH